jgi:quinol monooxygenase YgiN
MLARSTEAKMTTISRTANTLTLINTFKVAPDKQQALIDLLDRATENVMRKQPGFISANIHRSLDGTKVANYAQWRSKADLEAMQKTPEAGLHMKEAAALADSFEPILYEIFSVHGG